MGSLVPAAYHYLLLQKLKSEKWKLPSKRSFSSFRHSEITCLVTLTKKVNLLEQVPNENVCDTGVAATLTVKILNAAELKLRDSSVR